MRSDLRAPDQLRPVHIEPDFLPTAEGSALIVIGHTRVICTATVEDSVPSFLRGSGQGWLTGEYAMLPRATLTRTPRDAARGRISGRSHEIQRLIGRSLRAALDLTKLGERTVIVDCDVLQADGGTRTAAITGGFVAVALALRRMQQAGVFATLPVRDYLAAVSAGLIDGTPTLDLNYEEDARAEVDMNVVLTGSGRYVEIQGTSERRPFGDEQAQALLGLARAGAAKLFEAQRAVLALELGA
ncbi:MAG TPA: ribonuclease PH [Terriglobales bacterium]|nr:ribonuclease PH [Terriglobales bacterium]